MAIINYTDQLRYSGKGYIDAKMMPVKSFDDLKAFPMTQRFEGLTMVVLNDGSPQDYWLVGGITNSCWQPKTPSNFNDLRLTLEDGFLKLSDKGVILGDKIDLNSFFPSGDGGSGSGLHIENVDYTNANDKGEKGIFMCFTYSDGTKKYLDMSQFVSNLYEPGDGIVIDGKVISIDSAISERINTLETQISELDTKKADGSIVEDLSNRLTDTIQRISAVESTHTKDIESIQTQLNEEKGAREDFDKASKTAINKLQAQIKVANTAIDENKSSILTNATEISALKERVNALSSAAEGSTPDGKTIGITNDGQKSLYVKILERDGNILSVENNEKGETGLYARIPVFYEDEELNNE